MMQLIALVNTRRRVGVGAAAVAAIVIAACGGGSSNPTAPSATSTTAVVTACTTLSGCATGDVKGVFILISVGAPFTYTFAGQTITGSSNLTRQFIGLSPGEYEIVGQANGGIGLTFSNSKGFGPTTLQVLEGNVSARGCSLVNFGDVGNPGSAPQNFRVRIRLADTDTSVCLT